MHNDHREQNSIIHYTTFPLSRFIGSGYQVRARGDECVFMDSLLLSFWLVSFHVHAVVAPVLQAVAVKSDLTDTTNPVKTRETTGSITHAFELINLC